MPGLSNKITNIIGTPLPNFVRQQLNTRSEKTSLDIRDNDNYKFLANKTGWIRVISSIDLITQTDIDYFRQELGAAVAISDQQGLAEEYTLFGGTSKYVKVENGASYKLRSGIEYNGAYGMLGANEIKEYGYRPMPGITSAKISTQGRLGSVRSADISFKCWDKHQLDIIDALYFKLGFSMFIEWGNTTFYNSLTGKLESGEDYAIDVFDKTLVQDKDTVRTRIYQNIIKSEGNYDAMLGIVTNFNYSFSQDGGYDCTIKVLSLGILADSMKVNKIQELPEIAKDQISTIFNALQSLEQQSAARQQAEKQAELDEIVAATRKQEDEEAEKKGQKIIRDYSTYVKEFITSPSDQTKTDFTIYPAFIGLSNGKNYISYLKSNSEIYAAFELSKAYLNYPKDGSKKYLVTIKSISLGQDIRHNVNRFEDTTGIPLSINYQHQGKIDLLVDNTDGIDDVIDTNNEKIFFLTDENKPGIYYPLQGAGNQLYYFNVFFSIVGTKTIAGANAGTIDISKLKKATQIEYIQGIVTLIEKTFAADTISNLLLENDETELLTYGSNIPMIAPSPIRIGTSRNAGNIDRMVIRLRSSIAFDVEENSKQVGGGNVAQQGAKVTTTYTFPVWIEFTNPDIIQSIKLYEEVPPAGAPAAGGAGDGGGGGGGQTAAETEAPEGPKAKPITVGDVQKSEAMKYKSALEIMLRTIQLKQIADSVSKIRIGDGGSFVFTEAQKINLLDPNYLDSFTKPLFSSGVFTEFFSDLIEGKITNDQEFIKVAAKYGFNSNLMKDPSGFLNLIKSSEILEKELAVDYKSLMYSYLVPYKVQNTLAEGLNLPAYPVYITLGLFLMMLNHMCVLYNQQDQEKVKKPLIYIDFNNKTNFCLANELVISTNPLAFLVPFEGSRDSYKKLFEDVADQGTGVYSITADGVTTPLFNPEDTNNDNILSGLLSPKYRYSQLDGAVNKASAYRGNIMNILVNIDYLLNTVDSFIKEDDESSVYLKPLLEKVVTDINKAMGNINVFRVAFNDYADTYYIVDDQVVPPSEKEDKINQFGTDNKGNTTLLPLFGKNSIANTLEIKTEISTRLSNMIAISANSKIDQKYAASKDASAVGYLNTGFQDRYKKRILDQVPSTGSFNEVTKKSAVQFNETIKNFYSSDTAPLDKIAQATQYFMERMNKIKAVEPPTRAAAMIPVSVNFSTDGISGMAMGQSFTIQDELLPYSYTTRKMPYGLPNYQKKVGFVIIGLDHEISNNRWSTSVRSNMYFIKDADMYAEIKLTYSNTDQANFSTNDEETVTYEEVGQTGTGCDRKAIKKCGKDPDNQVPCDDMECLKADLPRRKAEYADKKIRSSNFNFNYSSLSGRYLTYTKNSRGEAVSDGSGGPFGKYYGPGMKEIRGIMLHHTADPAKKDGTITTSVYNNASRQVSYNYVIGYTGNVYIIAPKNANAYHAGTGYFKNLSGKECGVTFKCSSCGPVPVGGGGANFYYIGVSMEGAPGYDKTFGNGSADQFDSTARLTIKLMEENGLTPSASRPLTDIIITHGIYTYRKFDLVPKAYNEVLWRIRTLKPQWANF